MYDGSPSLSLSLSFLDDPRSFGNAKVFFMRTEERGECVDVSFTGSVCKEAHAAVSRV